MKNSRLFQLLALCVYISNLRLGFTSMGFLHLSWILRAFLLIIQLYTLIAAFIVGSCARFKSCIIFVCKLLVSEQRDARSIYFYNVFRADCCTWPLHSVYLAG